MEAGNLHSIMPAKVHGPTQWFLKSVFVAKSLGGLLKGDSSNIDPHPIVRDSK